MKRYRKTTREKLADALAAQGIAIWPDDLRSNPSFGYRDTYRWEGYGKRGTLDVFLTSWDTMADCARRGIAIEWEGSIGEVWALRPPIEESGRHGS